MRLITRADFDGIVCGVLVTARETIDRFVFVEPKAMQDGEVAVNSQDIIANLPHHPKCYLWFDHHVTNQIAGPFRGRFRLAPSAARVVFEYYPAESVEKFSELVREADRIDSGGLSVEDILAPQGHVLLSFTIDPREKTDEPYWIEMIHLLREKSLAEVMENQGVQSRCRRVQEDFKIFKALVLKKSYQDGNVVITDFRNELFRGRENRFLVYSLFPDVRFSVRVFRDAQRAGRTGISVGKNIFNKSSNVNVGELLSRYGGGGHEGAGSSRIPDEEADSVLREIVTILKSDR